MTEIKDIKEIVRRARELLEEKKAEDIVCLYVGEHSSVTDYFLVASGTSAPHIKALAEHIELELKKEGVRPFRHAGTPESQWLVVDYLDLIVHIFSAETRAYYDLERLWSDARVVT